MSFLKDPSVQLRFNNFTSDDIDLELGTPQGSPLSPVLSIIYASPLFHLAKSWDDPSLYMYVDGEDSFVWAPSYSVLASRLRTFLLSVPRLLPKSRSNHSRRRRKFLFFSRRRSNLNIHGVCPDSIFLPDWEHRTYYQVKASNHVRYLGFHLDHKLSWYKHIQVVPARTMSTIKALQLLGNSVRSLDFANWRWM